MDKENTSGLMRVSIRKQHAAFLDAVAAVLNLTNIEWLALLHTYFLLTAKRLGVTNEELQSLHESCEIAATNTLTATAKTEGVH